jgi:hypothetical protein
MVKAYPVLMAAIPSRCRIQKRLGDRLKVGGDAAVTGCTVG